MSPFGVLRVTEKLMLLPLMAPVTGASPRWPFSCSGDFGPVLLQRERLSHSVAVPASRTEIPGAGDLHIRRQCRVR